ncbi:guanine nucleotide exchange factor for Rab-3A isoform X2 [Tachysurus ichikawai]
MEIDRLIDFEAELEPGTESGEGRGETMLQEETDTQRREAYSVSRLRSSSIEIREKGTEFLREQLDAAQKLSRSVQSAVENNFLTIEPVALTASPMDKASSIECGGLKKCALSGMSHLCRHRIKLGDKENYYYISPSSRARITAVCNFFTYIRYIQQGLVRHDAEQMFCEVMRLRREMSIAKLGFIFTDEN